MKSTMKSSLSECSVIFWTDESCYEPPQKIFYSFLPVVSFDVLCLACNILATSSTTRAEGLATAATLQAYSSSLGSLMMFAMLNGFIDRSQNG